MNPFELIDNLITSNGNNEITASELRTVLKGILGSGMVTVPTDTLTSADAGKLVMYDPATSKAVLTAINSGLTAQAYEGNIYFDGFSINSPKPSKNWFTFNYIPVAGEILKISAFNIVFVSTPPVSIYECEIGLTLSDCAKYLATTLGSFAPQYFKNITVSSNIIEFESGNDYHGTAYSSLIVSVPVSISWIIIEPGVNQDLDSLGTPLIRLDRNGNVYILYLGDIVASSRPSGVLLNGYRWPLTVSQIEDNVIDAMISLPGFDSLNVIGGSPLNVLEITPPSSHVTNMENLLSSILVINITEGIPGAAGWVENPVLGQLTAVEDGTAYISRGHIYDCKTDVDVIHGTNVLTRLLVPGTAGSLTSPDLYLLNSGAYIGNPFFFALTEASAGQSVLCERFIFIGE